jgi:hypothetical protein
MDGRIAHDAAAAQPFAPGFELRFDQRDDRPARREKRARAIEQRDDRDERRVDDDQVERQFVRSTTVTRGSLRSDAASCP